MSLPLPSVQLDVVQEDSGAGVDAESLIANRDPQPGEVQVALRCPIEFDHLPLAPFSETGPFAYAVSVNDVLALTWVGESIAFQNGWTGEIVPPRHFVLVPPSDYEQGAEVIVSVALFKILTETALEPVVWSFVASELTAPMLSEVAAVNTNQLVAKFSEPVAMVSAARSNDALNLANYAIQRISLPSALPPITAVERVSDREVLITTGFELTFGALYRLIVNAVADEFDNIIVAPTNAIEFAGYLPMWPAGRRFFLLDFVPSVAIAADTSGDLRRFIACLQDSTNLLLHSIDKWSEILDPDYAPESFVDAILEDLGNPFDTLHLDVIDKRKLAKLLIRIYQLKGTALGIVNVVRFFVGVESSVATFNGFGWRLGSDKLSSPATVATPNPAVIGAGARAMYSFRVVTEALLTDAQRERILEIARFMKGAQEHLVGVRDSTQPSAFAFWKLGFSHLGHAAISAG